jgi:hypothetical protein
MATSYGIMNTFLTPDVIAREALLILENNVVSSEMMTKSAVTEFTGAKVGDTIRVRRPAFFGVDEFARASGSPNTTVITQDAFETSVNLTIEKHFDVSFEVSSKELTLGVDDFNERLLKPAMSALSQKIDQYALTKIASLGGLYSAGAYTAPDDLEKFAQIVEKMNKQNIPMTNRKLLVTPAMQTKLYSIPEFVRADIRGGGFSSPISEASLGRFMGLDVVMSQMLPSHTASVGAQLAQADLNGTISVAGGLNEGDTQITVDLNNAPGAVFHAGDTVSVLYNDGVTRDHVLVAANPSVDPLVAGTADGNGVVTLNVFPGMYGVVSNAPAGGGRPVVVDDGIAASITSSAASFTMGAAFHPAAFQMVFVPQANPMGPGTSASTVNYNGMSLRVLQTYDHMHKRDLISVDCLVGVGCVDGRLGVRVPSQS